MPTGIISTNQSTTQHHLTFLFTYPVSGTSLSLNPDDGYIGNSYTGQYWRPASTCALPNLSTTAKIELGFNVRFGSYNSSTNKVPVYVDLILSESACWFTITNNVKNNYQEGYYFKYSINGSVKNVNNAGINEYINGVPNFTQTMYKTGTSKNYTFKSANASSNRTYVANRATILRTDSIEVTPVNGKVSVTISNIDLWFNFYWNSQTWKKLYATGQAKTFTSTATYYSDSITINPRTTNFHLVPNSVTLEPRLNGVTVTDRTFNVGDTDTVISDSIVRTAITTKSTELSKRLTITNNRSGMALGNIAWSTNNNNAVKLSPTNTTYTDVVFNGNKSNCTVTCKTLNPSNGTIITSNNASITFTENTVTNFSSNNRTLAVVNTVTGAITAKGGVNGTYAVTASYNGGLNSSIVFNSYLVPNQISVQVLNTTTNQPLVNNTLNYGESALIRAYVSPYNASNSMLSTYTGYRPITFNVNDVTIGSLGNTVQSNTAPYYEVIYTAPTGFGPNKTINISASPTNYSSLIVNTTIDINANEIHSLPNLVLTSGVSNGITVVDKGYCLCNFYLSAAEGETLTEAQKDYIKRSCTFIVNNTTYPPNDPSNLYVTANIANNENHSYIFDTSDNALYQCVYKVEGHNIGTNQSADWKYDVALSVSYVDDNDDTQIATATCDGLSQVEFAHITATPETAVLQQNSETVINIEYQATAPVSTQPIISYNGSLFVFTSVWHRDSLDYTKGTITLTINSNINYGYDTINVTVTDDNHNELTKTLPVIVVEDLSVNRIYSPYVYTKNNKLQFTHIRHPFIYPNAEYHDDNNLRLVFKMPDVSTFNLLDDIQIDIEYQNTPVPYVKTYSMKNDFELFSTSYPLINSDWDTIESIRIDSQQHTNYANNLFNNDLPTILQQYQDKYGEPPYCIFAGDQVVNNDMTKFTFKLILKPQFSNVNITGLITDVYVDRVVTVNDIQINDPMLGYDDTQPNNYSLQSYIDAYQSYSKGYLTYMSDSINDYGREICSLNHLGAKGQPISIKPFYEYCLSLHYINAIEKYLIDAYLKVSCQYQNMINVNFYMPLALACVEVDSYNTYRYLRKLYIPYHLTLKYGLKDHSLVSPVIINKTNVTIVNINDYLPENAVDDYPILATMEATTDSALANPHNIYVAKFMSSSFRNNYTLAPLEMTTFKFTISLSSVLMVHNKITTIN
jgi:hypothetical protein